ncbi:MAG: cytochrome c oxidase subunit II, partial [Thermoleophilia bacterium]|nr:cytochrome c oxidase subunit II [Thermoleophilia bacterium]
MRRRAVLQMLAIGVLTGLASGAAAYFIPWLPDASSKEAGAIDEVYWFVAIICALIFALVAGVSLYAGWKFRAPPDDMDDGSPIHGHTGLEIIWTAIPTALVVAIAIFSGVKLAQAENLPDGAGTIEVTGQQFAWSFSYPAIGKNVTSGELVLQAGKTVDLDLTAKDVIHSFWVREWR